jgi:osmotically-inducible protein OsmY
VSTNSDLERAVLSELFWDPAVRATEVAVSADGGRVTLRGTVGSLHQRRAACKAAKRVRGVTDVKDEVRVNLMDDYSRPDAELRGMALQALVWNGQVPDKGIDVTVKDGWITLTGEVEWQYQRDEAETAVANLIGVLGVVNEIEVVATPSEPDVRTRITEALTRSAQVEASGVRVTTSPGTVTLEGSVSSVAERDAAVAAAWAAPGVSEVDDQLRIDPRG